MKNLVINLTKYPYTYNLPDNMYGLDWSKFKNNYQHFIEKAITEAVISNKNQAVIDVSKLPVLSDSLRELKSFMDITPGTKYPVSAWNSRREEAKNFFTFPCICELDASGYIKQLTHNVPRI